MDPLGLDTLFFGEQGYYMGDKSRIKADGPHVGIVQGENGYSFVFADQSWADLFTDKPDEEITSEDEKKYNRVTKPSNEEIENTIEGSGVDKWQNKLFKYFYIATQSRGVGKAMDFISTQKYTLLHDKENLHSLFITESNGINVAHDHFNFGNFLWGAAADRLGIPYPYAIVGAHLNNRLNHKGEWDSRDDQLSIFMGYLWNSK